MDFVEERREREKKRESYYQERERKRQRYRDRETERQKKSTEWKYLLIRDLLFNKYLLACGHCLSKTDLINT